METFGGNCTLISWNFFQIPRTEPFFFPWIPPKSQKKKSEPYIQLTS